MIKKFIEFLRSIFCTKPIEELPVPEEHISKQEIIEITPDFKLVVETKEEPEKKLSKKKPGRPKKKKV